MKTIINRERTHGKKVTMGKKKEDFSSFVQGKKNGFLNTEQNKGKSLHKGSNNFTSQSHKTVNIKRGAK